MVDVVDVCARATRKECCREFVKPFEAASMRPGEYKVSFVWCMIWNWNFIISDLREIVSVSDSNNIFLRHESEDINRKKIGYLQNFGWFQFYICKQVMHGRLLCLIKSCGWGFYGTLILHRNDFCWISVGECDSWNRATNKCKNFEIFKGFLSEICKYVLNDHLWSSKINLKHFMKHW